METPIGFITLFEAVDAVGGATFGASWQYATPIDSDAEGNRHELVIKAIAGGCENGRIAAAYRRWDTGAEPLDPALWQRINWRNYFMTGTIDLELPLLDNKSQPVSDGRTARCTREIFVRRDTLERFILDYPMTITDGPPSADDGIAFRPTRGPKADVSKRVREQMQAELSTGTISADQLKRLPEKDLSARYSASRDTVRKARVTVLVETRSKPENK
jgi:hypothetical protein